MRLMCLTPNNSLGSSVSGIASLAEYLNLRYLVTVFYRLEHPSNGRLGSLGDGSQLQYWSYSDVVPLDIVSSESFTRYEVTAPLATHFLDGKPYLTRDSNPEPLG
jgi:hypothetical protein